VKKVLHNVVGLVLYIGLSVASGAPAIYNWTGTITHVFVDTGGVYTGAEVGDPFSGSFGYDTDAGAVDATFDRENAREYEFFSKVATVTDGVTQSVASGVTLSVTNNYPINDADELQVASAVFGRTVLPGTLLDSWELSAEADGVDPDVLEFAVEYASLDAAMYSDVNFKGTPPWNPPAPSGDADKLVIFYIVQEDAAENIIFYAVGTLDGSEATFNDVPPNYWAFSFIETLAASGITAGCGNNNYCPLSPVTRAQMAVFLERGMRGSNFNPPAATGNVFLDVGASDFAASFIEQFFLDGITSGCGGNNYCPGANVTRAQMAVFLLRAKHGASYSPPAATGVFNDVPLSHWAVHWIEQLAAEGITAGCDNNNYCPEAVVTRDQMAVFLVRTFAL